MPKFEEGTVVWWSGSVGKDACVVTGNREYAEELADNVYSIMMSNGRVHQAIESSLTLCDDLKELMKRKKQYDEQKRCRVWLAGLTQ